MAALNPGKDQVDAKALASRDGPTLREVAPDGLHEPVVSPAHELQQALHDADFRSGAFRERPMSNAMLVLTLVCVYALALMMMLGSISA